MYTEEGKLNDREIAAQGTADKKTVLLIGDSIRQCYCSYAKEMLREEVTVVFPTENCRDTHYTYVSLANWRNLVKDPDRVDAVYWNNGHWDAAHWGGDEESLTSPDEYGVMLTRVYRKLRRFFPRAKIVFATTTPMNPNGMQGPNPRTNEDIAAYNAAARRYLFDCDVQIDDLYEVCIGFDEGCFVDYCHLAEGASRSVAAHVCDTLRALLA